MNLFKKKFNPKDFFVLCQCSLRRIDAHKKKIETNVRVYTKEVVKFLKEGKEDKARYKVIALIKDDYKKEALSELITYLDILMQNAEVINAQQICPLNLKEACGSIIFAAPYFGDQDEMMMAREALIDKFGKGFPEECVNSKVVKTKLLKRLSCESVDENIIEFYLNKIARENGIKEEDEFPDDKEEKTVDPKKCVLGNIDEGYVNEKYVFSVMAKNKSGRRIRSGGDNVEAYISGPNKTKIVGKVKDFDDGTYDISFVPKEVGTYLFAIYINDEQMKTKINEIEIVEGEKEVDPSKCEIEDKTQTIVGKEKRIIVIARDEDGNRIKNGGDEFVGYISGPNDTKIVGEVEDNDNGTYDIIFTPEYEGDYACAVYLKKQKVGIIEFEAINPVKKPEPQPEPVKPSVDLSAMFTKSFPPNAHSGLRGLNSAAIVDIGTEFTKAGICSDIEPKTIFHTVVGKPTQKQLFGQGPARSIFVGDEALNKKGILQLRYPLVHGMINNHEDIEYIWDYIFTGGMSSELDNRPFLVMEHALYNLKDRIKTAEIVLEKHNAPGIMFGNESAFTLTNYDVMDGIVVELGGGFTQVVPMYQRMTQPNLVQKLEIGGNDLTQYLMQTITEDGVSLGNTSSEREIARDIKEKCGYVALNYKEELSKRNIEVTDTYMMPDGNIIDITKSRFKCFEPLFTPSLLSHDKNGLSYMLANALVQNQTLYKNIYLTGGVSFAKGLVERLEKDVSALLKSEIKVNVLEDRKYSSWKGAAKLAKCEDSFFDACVSKQQFEEYGSNIFENL